MGYRYSSFRQHNLLVSLAQVVVLVWKTQLPSKNITFTTRAMATNSFLLRVPTEQVSLVSVRVEGTIVHSIEYTVVVVVSVPGVAFGVNVLFA